MGKELFLCRLARKPPLSAVFFCKLRRKKIVPKVIFFSCIHTVEADSVHCDVIYTTELRERRNRYENN